MTGERKRASMQLLRDGGEHSEAFLRLKRPRLHGIIWMLYINFPATVLSVCTQREEEEEICTKL